MYEKYMKTQKSSDELTKNEDFEQKLYEAIAVLKGPSEIRKFFKDLCTPTEIQAMADRWGVVDEIKAGKSYRQIYNETGVSVTTIGRVARCIILGEGGYNIAYERVIKTVTTNKKRKKS